MRGIEHDYLDAHLCLPHREEQLLRVSRLTVCRFLVTSYFISRFANFSA